LTSDKAYVEQRFFSRCDSRRGIAFSSVVQLLTSCW